MERREAPREPCDRLPQASLAIGRPARRASGTQVLEGGGGPVARGPLRGARAPLGAPSRTALSAAAPCFISGAAIDGAFDQARHGVRTRVKKEKKGYSNWSVNSWWKVETANCLAGSMHSAVIPD